MKDNKLTIIIDRPAQAVFDYTLNPINTPEWINGIKTEETSEWPVKVNSTYRNTGDGATWNQYTLIELIDGQSFTLRSEPDKNLFVRYTFTILSDTSTRFDYHEWVEQPPLTHVFTLGALEKLKKILERN